MIALFLKSYSLNKAAKKTKIFGITIGCIWIALLFHLLLPSFRELLKILGFLVVPFTQRDF